MLPRLVFALVAILAALLASCVSPTRPRVDSSTLTGKVMCGYQGWFNCEGDGAQPTLTLAMVVPVTERTDPRVGACVAVAAAVGCLLVVGLFVAYWFVPFVPFV